MRTVLLSTTRKRHRSFPRALLLARTAVLPPKDGPKDEHHEVDPRDPHPLAPRDVQAPLALLPLVADLQEPLRVVRNHAVEFPFDGPLHHGFLVDGPHVQRSPFCFGVADEACAEEGQHERLLQHVERYVRNREELARVRYGEADVRDGEGGEVFCAEGEELDGPAAEDQALVPRFERVWGGGLNGFRDEAHDVVGVVVELKGS